MSIFDRIGRMLEYQGNLATADTIVVLDGGNSIFGSPPGSTFCAGVTRRT